MNILQELEKVDREIERSTREKNQAEGKLEEKTETLKKQFGISTKEVAKEVKKLESRRDKLGTAIESKFEALQKEYSWE